MANDCVIPAKDFNTWGQRNDYANGEELMVEITLAEYRELVTFKGVGEAEQHKLRMAGIDKDNEITRLKEQIVALKAMLVTPNNQEE